MRALRRCPRGRRRGADLLVRMHVLRLVRRGARARLPHLRRRARRATEATGGSVVSAQPLYLHLPFCAHRCGYCDFVTAVGRQQDHGRYVDALLAELELERDLLAPAVETIFLGGGTPTFTEP